MADNRDDKAAATTIDMRELKVEEVRLTRVYFECPRCMAIKPGQDFGLRLEDGKRLRNQSHCRACRSEQLAEK